MFRGSLRKRILASVGALVVLSLLGSTVSLYRISDVNETFEEINQAIVPLNKLLAQTKNDALVLRREMQTRLGYSKWFDSHWRPQPIPLWIRDILDSEVKRLHELIFVKWEDSQSSAKDRAEWKDWFATIEEGLDQLKQNASDLYLALEQDDESKAAEIYPKWVSSLDHWVRQIEWGLSQSERQLRKTFYLAESKVESLRTGLQIILFVVIGLSLILLWFGERTVRPLRHLTELVKQIATQGLKKEDRSQFPELNLDKNDELSELAREFHRMATTLLEREKTVETQKDRLKDQNRMLKEMGTLNSNVLTSIQSILIVVDSDGKIAQCNPVARSWLEGVDVHMDLFQSEKIQTLFGGHSIDTIAHLQEALKLGPVEIGEDVYAGSVLPLRERGSRGDTRGAIILLEDLTEEFQMQKRLKLAENMAAVGRMSAQVAHEVRNPLHSIGLEAEMALEMAKQHPVKSSLRTILAGVDRLEKITDNYLKLSRLSSGKKTSFDVRMALESVMATYSSVCEAKGIGVEWSHLENNRELRVQGDRDLLEQALGNLFQNAIQAVEGSEKRKILWEVGEAESGRIWIRIEDSGPGIDEKLQPKLFEPFFTTKAQGTGLGLPFVKRIVEDHGGEIEWSRSREGGAAFVVVLPVSLKEEKGEERESSRTHTISR